MHAEKMMADILPKAYEWAFELFVAAEPYTVDRPEWCGLFYRAFVICVKRFSQNQVCLCSWASQLPALASLGTKTHCML